MSELRQLRTFLCTLRGITAEFRVYRESSGVFSAFVEESDDIEGHPAKIPAELNQIVG